MSQQSNNGLWYGFTDDIDLVVSKFSSFEKNKDCNSIVTEYVIEGIRINDVDYSKLLDEGYYYRLSRYHVANVSFDKIKNIPPKYYGMLFVQKKTRIVFHFHIVFKTDELQFRFKVDSYGRKGKAIFLNVTSEKAGYEYGKIYSIAFDKKERKTINECQTNFEARPNYRFRDKILELPDITKLCCNNLQFTFVINMIMKNSFIGEEFILRND